MPSDRINQIRKLQKLTNAGLNKCKEALETSDGDFFLAAVDLLSEEQIHELQSSLLVRSGAGQSIADPVTAEEEELVNRLVAHLRKPQGRNHWITFCHATLPTRFLTDSEFRTALLTDPVGQLKKSWQLVASRIPEVDRLPDDSLSATNVRTADGKQVTVAELPEAASEWEASFMILMHPRRRLLLWSTPPQVFAVHRFSGDRRPHQASVSVHEYAVKQNHPYICRSRNTADLSLAPAALAEFVQQSAAW